MVSSLRFFFTKSYYSLLLLLFFFHIRSKRHRISYTMFFFSPRFSLLFDFLSVPFCVIMLFFIRIRTMNMLVELFCSLKLISKNVSYVSHERNGVTGKHDIHAYFVNEIEYVQCMKDDYRITWNRCAC